MFNKKKNLEQDLLYAIAEGERTRNMLLSFAKAQGWEYKSRAVKRWTSPRGCVADHDMSSEGWKEEVVLEWYWEKKGPIFNESNRNFGPDIPPYDIKLKLPKKSSKKKLK